MAIKSLIYNTPKYLPIAIGCCGDVIICLGDGWETKTASGLKFIIASVENKGRFLGNRGVPRAYGFENVRCEDVYQYNIRYDDSQLLVNPGTELPYVVTCNDISELFPYPFVINSLVDYIDVLPDWVVDSENVVQTVDQETQTFEVYIPIIDRVNSAFVGSFTLDLGILFDDTASDLSVYDTPAGGYTFTQAAILGGGTQVVQILSQDPNNVASAGTDNGIFVAIDSDDTIDGLGTSGSPLTVPPSIDLNNALTKGSDGRLFVCEPNNNTQSQGASAAAVTAIDAAATYVIYTSALFTINNTSACRDQEILIVGDNTLQAIFLDTGVWQIRIEDDINGAGFVTVATAQYGAFSPVGIVVPVPVIIPVNEVYTVAAGGSFTIQRRIVVQTVTPSPVGSQITAYALGMRAVIVGV